MSKWVTYVSALILSGLLLAGCGRVTAAPEGSSAREAEKDSGGLVSRLVGQSAPPITVPAGTAMVMRLDHGISSATAQAGDTFTGHLARPLVVNGRALAPQGAAVAGRVLAARKSGRLKDPGYLRIALTAVEVNGDMAPVRSSSIFIKGKAHTKRNLAWIGGGAAGGALIGGLAGGGSGALIGSAVGAGSGTAAAYATGKQNVGFSAERPLTFRLIEPVTVRK